MQARLRARQGGQARSCLDFAANEAGVSVRVKMWGSRDTILLLMSSPTSHLQDKSLNRSVRGSTLIETTHPGQAP